MHATSPEFHAAVRRGHEVVELVEFFFPEGEAGPVFDVEDGDFQIDAQAEVRHNAKLVVRTASASAREIRDALRTPGVEAQYSRGIRFADGTTETKVVFRGEIATGSLTLNRDGVGPIPLTVYDSFTRLQWAATSAFSVPAGRNYATAMRMIVQQFFPSARWGDLMSTPFVTPSLAYATETMVSTVLVEMARAIGADIFFDAQNRLNIAPVPLTTGRPSGWTFDLDNPSEVIEATVDTNYDEMPNGVVVTGQHSSGGTVVGQAWDTNTGSPTYYRSAYTRRPMFKRTEKVITQTQADTMARGLLEKALGGSEELTLKIVPNPLLTVGDLCLAQSSELGLSEGFVLDAIDGSCGKRSIGEPWTVRLRRGVVLDDLAVA